MKMLLTMCCFSCNKLTKTIVMQTKLSNDLSRLAASVDLDVFNEIQTSLAQVTTILADTERNWQPIYPDVNNEGLVGRPKFEISRDQLQYLVDYDLKISDISEGLRVSRSTIKRRLREYGISISERKMDILDSELDFIVRNIQ